MISGFWLSVGGILVLLASSFFFSGSETALTATSRARMHQLARGGSKRAAAVEALTENRERTIAALLLGNNIVNILAAALATSILIAIFGDAGIAYATIGMTLAVVIFSEVLPKTWAIGQPDEFSLGVAPVVKPIVTLLAPVTMTIQAMVRGLLMLLNVRIDSSRSGYTGHEEIRGTVDFLHREGEVIKGDRDMLGGILDLKDLEVADIMVHRTRLMALDSAQPADVLVTEILGSPYTRMPLYDGEPDNIIGVLHVRDVLRALVKAGGNVDKLNIAKIASKPWFVPETTPVQAQLNAFLKGKNHFALVIDEYGEVEGLITLEDILEEIVGDISDEHDEVIEGITKQADGTYLVDGVLPLRDLNRALDWNLPDSEATTIAGLVIHETRTIPSEGQLFTLYNLRVKVVGKTNNQLTQLQISPLRPGSKG